MTSSEAAFPAGDAENDRYARQRCFAPVGEAGQARLSEARVLILGCGALGSVAAEILARAGVGQLRLVDRDVVEWSNLQRQALYDEADAAAGRAKAAAAAERLRQINSEITVIPEVLDVTADNILRLLEGVDLVLDGTDNFGTRFLLNDACLETETPWVHAGCVGAEGQVLTLSGRGGPCFRCLVPEPPDAAAVATCDTAGVLGPATHAIASWQAAEAIKLLSGHRATWDGKLLSLHFWSGRLLTLDVPAADCPACRHGRRDYLRGEAAAAGDRAEVLCGRAAVQIPGRPGTTLDLVALAKRWEGLGEVQRTPFFVRLRFSEGGALTLFRDGRGVISGTEDIGQARALYARFVGG
jgi:adenylyltransferase/sulfurtransferase